jgi:membrane protein
LGRWLNKLKRIYVIRWIVIKLKRISIPGFHGRSVYDVSRFFLRSLFDEDILLRASSLAFNFFVALFPAIIFFFTLIAYIPIDNLHEEILLQIENIMPTNAYSTLLGTIEDILNIQHTGLLSFGFAMALIFASNGFTSLMTAFNKYVPNPDKRPWYTDRLRSFFLIFLITILILSSILLVIYVDYTIVWLKGKDWINERILIVGLNVVEYLSLFLLFYMIFSSMYYFGSSRVAKWRFFSAGSSLATVLSLFATAGFSYYINQFNSYNKLYGSIGTIIVLMMLIYFNCIVLLIGFELNSSIDRAEEIPRLKS